jgi:hypothetical protein
LAAPEGEEATGRLNLQMVGGRDEYLSIGGNSDIIGRREGEILMWRQGQFGYLEHRIQVVGTIRIKHEIATFAAGAQAAQRRSKR